MEKSNCTSLASACCIIHPLLPQVPATYVQLNTVRYTVQRHITLQVLSTNAHRSLNMQRMIEHILSHTFITVTGLNGWHRSDV